MLYNRAAQGSDLDRNPVVVIPGLLGSRLEDPASGLVVWGAFGGRYANPAKDEGLRLLALPISEQSRVEDIRSLEDPIEAVGVLDQVNLRIAGLPLDLNAYVQILATLGAGGYRDEELGRAGVVDYGEDHFTCFQFPYDWRRDLVASAAALDRFLEEKAVEVERNLVEHYGAEAAASRLPVRFDLVAHSLGSLVTRYYLRYGGEEPPPLGEPIPWTGALRVERVVLIGPPNAGSPRVLEVLVEGRDYGPTVPRYPSAMLGTYPSLYQLLPRARHGSLIDAESQEPVDPLDPEAWSRYRWGLLDPGQEEVLEALLPHLEPERRVAVVQQHLAALLARARVVQQALDRPGVPPQGVDLYLLAGDAEPTLKSLQVDPRRGRLEVESLGPGDGEVLRSSALMDERRVDGSWSQRLVSPVAWHSVIFLNEDHLGLTRSRSFQDNVLFLLLEQPR
ncbi:MAG: hypothetical protein AAGD01_01540 [Acidobacteriota bacterium]